MNAMQVRALLHELMDENPFAIRAVLRILSVEFTNAVPTLSVTNEPRPRLLINLEFVAKHCKTEEHVKALLCHEFLHVLLRHTDEPGAPTPARHLAADAVINAIIHRQLGEKYSDLMATYYRDAQGLMPLLRPMAQGECARYWDRRRGGGITPRGGAALAGCGPLTTGVVPLDRVAVLRARCQACVSEREIGAVVDQRRTPVDFVACRT